MQAHRFYHLLICLCVVLAGCGRCCDSSPLPTSSATPSSASPEVSSESTPPCCDVLSRQSILAGKLKTDAAAEQPAPPID